MLSLLGEEVRSSEGGGRRGANFMHSAGAPVTDEAVLVDVLCCRQATQPPHSLLTALG